MGPKVEVGVRDGDHMLDVAWGDPLAAQLAGGDARITGVDPANHLRWMAADVTGASGGSGGSRAAPGLPDMPTTPPDAVRGLSGDERAQADVPWWLDVFRFPYYDPESGEVVNPAREGASGAAQAAAESLTGDPGGVVPRVAWGALGAALVVVGAAALLFTTATGRAALDKVTP